MSETQEKYNSHSVAVIGGGLAGIAAAESAARQGWNVELFEWSKVLGGRAASQFDARSHRWIDNGQHVVLGCCTELLALNQRLGLTDLFARSDTVLFAATEKKRWNLAASLFLPPRWQLVPAFLKNPFLSFSDRLFTGLLLRKMAKIPTFNSSVFHSAKNSGDDFGGDSGSGSTAPKPFRNDLPKTFGDWLRKEGASEDSVNNFWNPLIFSALNETVDHACLYAAVKVVKDGFMSGRDAMSVYTPKCPLRDIYHYETLRKLQQLGITFHFTSRVAKICCNRDPKTRNDSTRNDLARNGAAKTGTDADYEQSRVTSLVLADGTVREFDKYILAIPPYRAWKLLEESNLADFADSLSFGRFELGAITSLHLWFDKPLLPTTQRQCAILNGVGQWIFMPIHGEHEFLPPNVTSFNKENNSVFNRGNNSVVNSNEKVFYHQIVISVSHRHLSDIELTSQGSKQLVGRALEQLKAVLPESFSGSDGANLVHSKVSTVYDAVFSPTPQIFRFRPQQKTPISNLALAGDWTQTDWPATMEGAVRSGQKAVEVLIET